MQLVLYDLPEDRKRLLPFTYTRAMGALRLGMTTLAEKWQYYFPQATFTYHTEPYLQALYPYQPVENQLWIRASLLPTPHLVVAMQQLKVGEALQHEGEWVAYRCHVPLKTGISEANLAYPILFAGSIQQLTAPWDLLQYQPSALHLDFIHLVKGYAKSCPIEDPHTIVYQPESVYIAPGVQLKAAILNATDGPIYIGPGAVVHERAVIHGPVAIGSGVHIRAGAYIGPHTSIGPYCKVGGEVQASIFMAYSNKAHEGFLGNSVIGSWCNLGAGSYTANLRNNYGTIKAWYYPAVERVTTGQQFLGLMLGDHSKCATGSIFPPGAVVGVSSHVMQDGVVPPFTPSFTWGGAATYRLEAALETAKRAMARRGKDCNLATEQLLATIFKLTSPHRENLLVQL